MIPDAHPSQPAPARDRGPSGPALQLLPGLPELPRDSAPAPSPNAAPGAPECWLAIQLPHLALDLQARRHADADRLAQHPLLIVERGERPRVHAANRAARRAGARPGMPLGDALALLDTPELIEDDPVARAREIHQLAAALLQFSDHVHPEPGAQRILLEVGRSRRLFGGLPALRERAEAVLRELGFQPRTGMARSPAAARLLAAHRHPEIPEDRDALRRSLARFPLGTLPLPATTREALQATGLRVFGELLRLPRAELARRHGPDLLQTIDRLLGDACETLPRFVPPATLELTLRLDHEIRASTALVFPLRRLLQQAEQQLRGRALSLQGMQLDLQHREDTTRLNLERGQPGIRAADWLSLWQTRLERETLQAPVIGLRLHSAELLEPPATDDGLLTGDPAGDHDDAGHGAGHPRHLPAVLARLRARLGAQQVGRLVNRGTPAPEDAQEPVFAAMRPGPDTATHPPSPAQRACGTALWVHAPEPVPAPRSGDTQPLGRLENGWWDRENDRRRDYALTRDVRGRWIWLFRCLRNGGWFRQGYWG